MCDNKKATTDLKAFGTFDMWSQNVCIYMAEKYHLPTESIMHLAHTSGFSKAGNDIIDYIGNLLTDPNQKTREKILGIMCSCLKQEMVSNFYLKIFMMFDQSRYCKEDVISYVERVLKIGEYRDTIETRNLQTTMLRAYIKARENNISYSYIEEFPEAKSERALILMYNAAKYEIHPDKLHVIAAHKYDCDQIKLLEKELKKIKWYEYRNRYYSM